MRVALVATALALGLGLAACGEDTTGDDGRVSSTPSSDSEPLEDLSRTPDPKGPQVRVEGTVTEGVEHGCLLLAAAGQEYLLLGARPEVGARVEVVGTVDRDAMTTCQQGVPLRVQEINER
ncbi:MULTISPECIES: hypothetical protein [unclassified Nocardioides]|uniref:hypothetical protein n=1 Tax=unclassified Nocardioides TaxID=2615069 RepID=UPI00362469DD